VTSSSNQLVNVLRSTLKRLESSEQLASDDPALNELKGSLLSSITELEVAKTPKPPAPPTRILWISKKAYDDVQADAQTEVQAEAERPADSEPIHLEPDSVKK
jgi:hypothetical protein